MDCWHEKDKKSSQPCPATEPRVCWITRMCCSYKIKIKMSFKLYREASCDYTENKRERMISTGQNNRKSAETIILEQLSKWQKKKCFFCLLFTFELSRVEQRKNGIFRAITALWTGPPQQTTWRTATRENKLIHVNGSLNRASIVDLHIILEPNNRLSWNLVRTSRQQWSPSILSCVWSD
jgi:hypothetical protein